MSSAHYDAAIVLGGGEGINPDGSLSEQTKPRLLLAARLYSEKTVPSIIVCGSHSYKDLKRPIVTEAQAYADYLSHLDVPRKDIFLESRSQDTLGNILFAKMDILLKQNWKCVLVIPSANHSVERVNYLLQKVLGNDYEWKILQDVVNNDPKNYARELGSLQRTQEINDRFTDGDHDAIYQGLLKTHPAYGGNRWTIDELRKR